MDSLPLVSVVIPAYNHEKFAARAVASVLAQTWPHIELLVLDDGSKDATLAVLTSLTAPCTKRFSRFWLQTQPNQGTCKTLTRLFKEARGEYLLILASDDELLPECIEEQVRFMQAHPDMVLNAPDNEFIDASGRPLERDFPSGAVFPRGTDPRHAQTFGGWLKRLRPDVDFTSSEFGSYASLVQGNYLPNGLMFRKSVLDACAPLTPEAPLEDWFLNLQMAKRGAFHYTARPLFRYRIHGNNTISDAKRMGRMTALTWQYEWMLAKQDVNPHWKNILNALFFTFHTVRRIGPSRLCILRRASRVFSQRVFCAGRKEFIFYSRNREPLPAWWIPGTYKL